MNSTMTLSDIASILNTRFIGEDRACTGFSTDTRSIKNGDVFVALRGEVFDGHEFLSNAFEQGAVAALVDKEFFEKNIETNKPGYPALLVVEDTLLAYGAIGAHHLAACSAKKIAITGSCGKTSVKEILSSMLSVVGNVLATQGNFNNEVGVPHTLLAVKQQHDFAVVELGANHVGEIAYLSDLVKPDVVALLNADRAHLEGFGSIENVVSAKGEIFSGARKNAKAVLSLDEKHFAFWNDLVQKNNLSLVTTSLKNPAADIVLLETQRLQQGFSLLINVSGTHHKMHLPLLGEHNIKNALAAIGVCHALGLPVDVMAQGLANAQPAQGRLKPLTFINAQTNIKYTVVDDTYNANPLSVRAAIDVLSSYNELKILILGDMAELGEDSQAMHQEMGVYSNEKNIDLLLSCGDFSKESFLSFQGEGKAYPNKQELLSELNTWLPKEQSAVFLVKGSRSAGMEELVNSLALLGEAA